MILAGLDSFFGSPQGRLHGWAYAMGQTSAVVLFRPFLFSGKGFRRFVNPSIFDGIFFPGIFFVHDVLFYCL